GRVNPYQSKKMAARMQALESKNPVLLKVNFGAGHGRGTKRSDRISQQADVFAFLFKELGL
ncbi:MAG: prolyl oligopeptidase family serine peptidase, partial [Bdellovibrionales bacterium]|nr:prolyl oligopeptidase family serine peptidase [Bdellovibrionales bacterium]